MGLFNILKNGIILEKRRETPTTEVKTEECNEETETFEQPNEEVAEPVNTFNPTSEISQNIQTDFNDKRMEAASVLYGDNGLTGGSTPSLIHFTQPQPKPVPNPTEILNQPAPTETVTQIFNTHNNTHSSNFDNALLGQVSANQNLLVIAPQTSAEISTILTNLANGNACIVSLSKFSAQDGQRFLDYICGFVNAIGGMIMQKSASEFILAPKGVNIKNN